jgi:hypothetical protein
MADSTGGEFFANSAAPRAELRLRPDRAGETDVSVVPCAEESVAEPTEPADPVVSAKATGAEPKPIAPMPSAIASAPTRPMRWTHGVSKTGQILRCSATTSSFPR